MGKYSLSIRNLKCLYDDKWFKGKTGKRCPCMYKKKYSNSRYQNGEYTIIINYINLHNYTHIQIQIYIYIIHIPVLMIIRTRDKFEILQ